MFKLTFGVDITHVPFNGGGPATASTLGGHVPIAVSALPTAVTYIRGGQLRALGMFSSKRSSALPDIPTMMEATGHDLPADIVNGFVAPAGTPKPVIDLIHREVVKVMAMPDTREKLAAMGFDPVASTPEEFAELDQDRDRALGQGDPRRQHRAAVIMRYCSILTPRRSRPPWPSSGFRRR